MMKASRARYTLEFKQEAVRLVESGQSIAAASRTLGLVEQTLFNWVKAHREGRLKGADSRSKVTAEQMEISRLRAELARSDGARHPGKSYGVLCQGAEVKYALIRRNRRVWPMSKTPYVGQMARLMVFLTHKPRRNFRQILMTSECSGTHISREPRSNANLAHSFL